MFSLCCSNYPVVDVRRNPGSSKVDLMTMDDNEVNGAGQISILTPDQAPAAAPLPGTNSTEHPKTRKIPKLDN